MPTSWAGSFHVNSLVDATDANPGDGICETAAGSDECTLRAAVQETNALPGLDNISIPAGLYVLSIVDAGVDDAATGDLDLNDDLVLAGAGAALTTVDGGGIDRVFHMAKFADLSVEITDMTIQNGRGQGGGVLVRRGTLTITRCAITNNSDPACCGGGLYIRSLGTLVVVDSAIIGNSAGLTGGGILADGDITVTGSVISDNNGGIVGGGIQAVDEVTIENSIVSHNRATHGAGLDIQDATISESTIANNVAFSRGGGVRADGVVSIANSTLSGNSAERGGAVVSFLDGEVTITNSTIHNNSSDEAGSLWSDPFSGITISVANTIVSGNPIGPNCSGVISLGGNLDSGTSCMFMEPGDLSSVDPMLDQLADNGGPTPTHALLSGSPAIDFAGGCALATDQRGASRPGDGCDSGSFEYIECPDLVLSDETIMGTETRENCQRIVVGPDFSIADGGSLTLKAGKSVAMGDRSSVDSGGQLALEIDPDLQLVPLP